MAISKHSCVVIYLFPFQLQTQRLSTVENSAKDATFQVDDLKYKETVSILAPII